MLCWFLLYRKWFGHSRTYALSLWGFFPVRVSTVHQVCSHQISTPHIVPECTQSVSNSQLHPLPPGHPYIWPSLEAQTVENLPARQETWVPSIPWRREQRPTPVFSGLPWWCPLCLCLYLCFANEIISVICTSQFLPYFAPLSFPLLKYSNKDIKFTVRKFLILTN